jgi:hypothetical protein
MLSENKDITILLQFVTANIINIVITCTNFVVYKMR